MDSTSRITNRYLVTGGCGFIGSHLVDALIEMGHQVIVIDDLSTGLRDNLNPAASLIVGDVTSYALIEETMRHVDGCFHLAAVASVEKATQEWVRCHTINQTATINIFQAASRQGRKIPVVYTSSAAVYGDCPELPISEAAPVNPLSAYGVDKLGCDQHGYVAWAIHRVPNVGVRPFNIYGPRQDPASPYSGVISIFADRMLRGDNVIIFGDGEQQRDFVYVTDAVKVFYTAMAHLEQRTLKGHEIFNICTGKATSINDLATNLASLTGYTEPLSHALPRHGDIRLSVGNPAKLLDLLGLKLSTGLRHGLTETLGALQKQPVLRVAA
jgi:UDP-glucose 4-epimerase